MIREVEDLSAVDQPYTKSNRRSIDLDGYNWSWKVVVSCSEGSKMTLIEICNPKLTEIFCPKARDAEGQGVTKNCHNKVAKAQIIGSDNEPQSRSITVKKIASTK